MKSTNELKHSISRGYDLEITPPALPCTPLADCDVFYDPELTAWLKVRGLDIASKFSFLNLGLLAYLGGKSKSFFLVKAINEAMSLASFESTIAKKCQLLIKHQVERHCRKFN